MSEPDMKPTTELVPDGGDKGSPMVLSPSNPQAADVLIAQAIDQKVPVETMEKLLAMRRELRAEAAKEAFDRDMASFQGEAPVIEKTKIVLGKDKVERYRYAPIEAIVDQVKAILSKHGFSYLVTTDQVDAQYVSANCIVKHKFGHSEVSTFKVPIDAASFMSAPQRVAAALTFAKRYAFCNAFGIMTGDEDNDANEPELKVSQSAKAPEEPKEKPTIKNPGEPASDAQLRAIATLRSKYGMPDEVFKAAYKVTSTKELTKGQASAAIEALKKRVDAGEQWVDPNLPTVSPEEPVGTEPQPPKWDKWKKKEGEIANNLQSG